MKVYTHNPIQVAAIQVSRPFGRVKKEVPFAREIKNGSGRFLYFQVSNVGETVTHDAFEDDWIVRLPGGRYITMKDADFQPSYGDGDDSSAETPTA